MTDTDDMHKSAEGTSDDMEIANPDATITYESPEQTVTIKGKSIDGLRSNIVIELEPERKLNELGDVEDDCGLLGLLLTSILKRSSESV